MKLPTITVLRNLFMIRSTLSEFHPLLIEGHTRDDRDPQHVANRIVNNLDRHWKERNITKPIILISQGDPLTKTGISAITRAVADELNIKRCLITLDEDIDPNHSNLADRHDVIYELKYSQLVEILHGHEQNALTKLSQAVDDKILYKNDKRSKIGKQELANWYKTYALLQEVTKSALKIVSDGSKLGSLEGSKDGRRLGSDDGEELGSLDGSNEGSLEGNREGSDDGNMETDGISDGTLEGVDVGRKVGNGLGIGEGGREGEALIL